MRALLLLFALTACDTPDLTITYLVAGGNTGPSCGPTGVTCGEVDMQCTSVLYLRVLRPTDPAAPFISICEEVAPNGTKDMCAIGRIELPIVTLPRENLEVQVTVWPKAMVVDEETGVLNCGKLPLNFDATFGFPVAGNLNPAFGGRAFYHPGDDETFVTLGCTDLVSVNAASCAGQQAIQVTATVGDFENLPFSVSSTIGDRLAITIGEPQQVDDRHQLNSASVATLDRTTQGPTPAWGGGVDLSLGSSACIQVLEDGAQTTSALRCKTVTPTETSLDLPGVRLPRSTLDQILTSLSLLKFPEEGLTVGVVIDSVGAPIPGVVINATGGTVEYINAARNGLVSGQTSSSGIFVSRDAPYNTLFSTFIIDQMVPPALGGRVDGKVTVVILQSDTQIGS